MADGCAADEHAAAMCKLLVCPACGAALVPDAECACAAATRLELWHGIPRLLFGQEGVGAAPQLDRILAAMDAAPWQQAVKQVFANEALERRLCGPSASAFVYSIPWDEIDSVLDIGSGMGAETAPLAERAKLVVAVEADPRQALFQRKRAAQDGFGNWQPVIADATALPFAPATFDLVTLHGEFDCRGVGSAGGWRRQRQRILTQVFRLLKPNGYLYLSVASGAPRTLRSSAGLACARLLPRWLTDWYGERRTVPANGSVQRSPGSRIFTATPAQLKTDFNEAGFASVDVFATRGDVTWQQILYRLGDVRERHATLQIVDPPVTWKGLLRRRLVDASPWHHLGEDELVVFARKSRHGGRLAWADLPHDGPITEFTTSNKVFALCFTDGQPGSVFIAPRNAYAHAALAKEYTLLLAATERCGADVEAWPLRWPKPLRFLQQHGQTLYHYEFANGIPLSRLLLPISYDPGRFHRLLAQLMQNYVELCMRMTAALPASGHAGCLDLLDRLTSVNFDDKVLSTSLEAACVRLRRNPWPAHVTHGDLSLSNTIVLPRGAMVLVDWENAGGAGLVAIDLLRLLYDTWDDSRRLKPKTHQAVMARATQAARAALERLGIGPEAYADVEALFTAHQIQLGLARNFGPEKLLQAYHARAFALRPA